MVSRNILALRKHYHELFNLGLEHAFDELADENYKENGKASDGEGLKQWLQTLRDRIEINVNIITEVEEGNMVGIYWVTNSIERATGKRLPPAHGMNLYEFSDEGKVLNNWHARAAKPEPSTDS